MRKLVACLILPVLALVAGCDSKMDMQIKSENDISIELTTTEKASALPPEISASDITDSCTQMEQETKKDLGGKTARVDKIDTGGEVGCSVKVSGATMEEVKQGNSFKTFTHENGVWTIEGDMDSSGTPPEIPAGFTFRFTYSITFPGPVTEASDGGKISGNTVTWEVSDLNNPPQIRAVAQDSGIALAPESQTVSGTDAESGAAATHDNHQDSSSGKLFLWIGLGALVIILIGVVVFLIIHNKRKKELSQIPQGALYYGQQSGQNGGSSQYPGPTQQQPGPYSQPSQYPGPTQQQPGPYSQPSQYPGPTQQQPGPYSQPSQDQWPPHKG